LNFESNPDVADVCTLRVVLVLLLSFTTVVLSMFAACEEIDATTAMRRQKADDVHNETIMPFSEVWLKHFTQEFYEYHH